MVFKNLCILVLWTKVALALEGLKWSEVGLGKEEIRVSYANGWGEHLEFVDFVAIL